MATVPALTGSGSLQTCTCPPDPTGPRSEDRIPNLMTGSRWRTDHLRYRRAIGMLYLQHHLLFLDGGFGGAVRLLHMLPLHTQVSFCNRLAGSIRSMTDWRLPSRDGHDSLPSSLVINGCQPLHWGGCACIFWKVIFSDIREGQARYDFDPNTPP